MPKMILQPFIENAFFHAFPQGENGNILVCIREMQNRIKFEIIDDGVGMDVKEVHEVDNSGRSKGEHFSGIGINNIIERLNLIYGTNCSVNINSSPGEGTTISVMLPKQYKENK